MVRESLLIIIPFLKVDALLQDLQVFLNDISVTKNT